MDFADCAGIKQEPEDLLTAAARRPSSAAAAGPSPSAPSPRSWRLRRAAETVDLTLEEPARGPPRLLILAAAAAALYYAPGAWARSSRPGPEPFLSPSSMEALLDLMAFALPIFFLGASAAWSARRASRARRARPHPAEQRNLTEWDLALMAGRMLDGNRLEPGHRLKLEDGARPSGTARPGSTIRRASR
eukprot:tig00000471_g1176.t1